MIKIGRAIEGISINGREWLLDKKNQIKVFKDRGEAINFLQSNGFSDYSEIELEDSFFFEEIEES